MTVTLITNPDSQKYLVTLEPIGRKIEVTSATSVLEAAQDAGVDLMAVCAGMGTCGMCKVYTIGGIFSAVTQTEQELLSPTELRSGMRLACETQILSECTVQFPPESLATLQRLQLEGQLSEIPVEPAVDILDLDLEDLSEKEAASILDLALKEIINFRKSFVSIPENPRSELLETLCNNHWKARIVVSDFEIVTVLPPESQVAGLAVDIGTTKIAGYLVDLQTGRTMATSGASNPQIAYGEDVISRIKYIDDHDHGGKVLQDILAEAINSLAGDLCQQCGITRGQIVDSVMVGNTVMHHLFLGIPVKSLGAAPYQTTAVQSMNVRARDYGINLAEGAFIYLPPNIASFVGGDHVAMLLSTDAQNRAKTVLAVDIGTNTEISLIHEGSHYSCSCASGPAFEGAHISDGMRAIPGAIEKIYFDHGKPTVKTIQNKPAIGICGSGILDAVAELHREKLIDQRGAFDKLDDRVKMRNGKPEIVLVDAQQSGHGREISINHNDVHQIQLAKAAIRTGVDVLLAHAKLDPDDVELVLLAGAFGTYLDVHSALEIGMFPRLPFERFQQVGNAAGSGAREMLISKNRRKKAEQMTATIKFIELVSVSDYTDIFINAINFS